MGGDHEHAQYRKALELWEDQPAPKDDKEDLLDSKLAVFFELEWPIVEVKI